MLNTFSSPSWPRISWAQWRYSLTIQISLCARSHSSVVLQCWTGTEGLGWSRQMLGSTRQYLENCDSVLPGGPGRPWVLILVAPLSHGRPTHFVAMHCFCFLCDLHTLAVTFRGLRTVLWTLLEHTQVRLVNSWITFALLTSLLRLSELRAHLTQ